MICLGAFDDVHETLKAPRQVRITSSRDSRADKAPAPMLSPALSLEGIALTSGEALDALCRDVHAEAGGPEALLLALPPATPMPPPMSGEADAATGGRPSGLAGRLTRGPHPALSGMGVPCVKWRRRASFELRAVAEPEGL
mmetsp:Transcript_59750/g.166814  ORF Transcript_59750/g.166814 Transcript_59750/m.166814 type:complete len:141 (+) Transcript_59750:244-666(+)